MYNTAVHDDVTEHRRKEKKPRPGCGLSLFRGNFSKARRRALKNRLSGGASIVGRGFAERRSATIRRDLLGFTQRPEPGTFRQRDLHEHVVAAVVRLDDAHSPWLR